MRTAASQSDRRGSSSAPIVGSLPDACRRLWFGLPAVAMIVGVLALAWYCRTLLTDAAAGRPIVLGGAGFWLVVVGFLGAAAAMLVAQCTRLTQCIAGPEQRLRVALLRIRFGDVGFRIALRRGDPLRELANECNAVLDYLNRNPPAGANTGGDVVDVAVEEAEGVAP